MRVGLWADGERPRGTLNYLAIPPACPRSVAEDLVRDVAPLYGIGVLVLAAENDEDWRAIFRMTPNTRDESKSPDPNAMYIPPLMETPAATIVFLSSPAEGMGPRLYGERLMDLRMTIQTVAGRVN